MRNQQTKQTKTLIHHAFQIWSNWCFTIKLVTFKKYLSKNSYSKNLIEREINTYLEKQFNIEPTKISNTVKVSYCKFSYIGHFSKTTKQKIKENL